MYLHLGQDTVVRTKDIIGIFDLDTSSVSKLTREYLAAIEKRGEVINVSMELPKSFVVCRPRRKTEKCRVYISQISSATLLKRSRSGNKAALEGSHLG